MNFFDTQNNKFLSDLQKGKLPAIVIDNTSILTLSGSLLAVAIIAILIYRITK